MKWEVCVNQVSGKIECHAHKQITATTNERDRNFAPRIVVYSFVDAAAVAVADNKIEYLEQKMNDTPSRST